MNRRKIEDVRCYPQAFAAAVTMMDRLLDKPRVLIVDIGGFTADYLMMRSGRADLSICDSLENGVILLYNRIRTKANSEFDILLEETDIDGILKDGESTYAPKVSSLVEKLAQDFVNDLANSLRERMLEKQGPRCKAQFLVNAVLHYINCPETPDIAIPQTVDRAAIEEIVAEILSQKENVRQTEDKTEIKSETIWKQGAFKSEKKPDGEYPPKEMDQATRALIADTMSAFRSN